MKKELARRHRRGAKEVHLGFQIAPMIDVVFVILLFFIVAAGNHRKETGFNYELPGGSTSCGPMPDEISIRIESDGQVLLNDETLDAPEAKSLPALAASVRDLKSAVGGNAAKIAILFSFDQQVKYQRMVDVLDVLSSAGISQITFENASE